MIAISALMMFPAFWVIDFLIGSSLFYESWVRSHLFRRNWKSRGGPVVVQPLGRTRYILDESRIQFHVTQHEYEADAFARDGGRLEAVERGAEKPE